MQVEIYSDVACPWCYVGKRRFEAAMADFAHADAVEVVWRSFELDPGSTPSRSEQVTDHLAAKYRTSRTNAQEMVDRMRATGAELGLDLAFDRVRLANTFDAHRVIHLARTHGFDDAMKERLLAAYFTEGKLVSDRQVLVGLAEEVGLDAGAVAEALDTGAFADDVRAEEAEAATLGISAVPFFVIDRTYGISGAQPAAVLRAGLEQAWTASHPTLTTLGGDGEMCGPEGCEVEDGRRAG